MVEGACPYCGQIKMIEVIGEAGVTGEQIDDMAMMQCDCPEAQNERFRRKKIKKASVDIKTLFADDEKTAEIAVLLNAGLTAMVHHKISKMTIEIDDIKAKLSETSKGGIKVERTITKKEALES